MRRLFAMALPIEIDRDAVAMFCRRNHIQKLALFGAVLTEDFGPERMFVKTRVVVSGA
jgi:hypothetical protein